MLSLYKFAILSLFYSLHSIYGYSTEFPQANDSWPRLPRSQVMKGLNTAECQDMQTYMGLSADAANWQLRTDSLAIIHEGKILFSINKDPFSDTTPHPLWSASKSVLSALIGAAIQAEFKNPNGQKLALSDRLADYIEPPENLALDKKELYAQMTLKHLLEMGSGIDWNEAYDKGMRNSHVLRLVYLEGFKNMKNFVMNQLPFMKEKPGKKFNYSSGDMSLLAYALVRSCEVSGCDPQNLPWQLLFEPLGMKQVAFEQDGSGLYVGSSYVHMSLLDMARFGLLYLNKGKWQNRQIISQEYIELTQKINDSYQGENTVIRNLLDDGVYGLTWWLNRPYKNMTPSYPAFPEDMYAALGHYGQMIMVFPKMNMVLVRTGNDFQYNGKINGFGERLFPCLKKFGVEKQ